MTFKIKIVFNIFFYIFISHTIVNITNIFNKVIEKSSSIHNNYRSRKIDKSIYFKAYVQFFRNSIYYSRFQYHYNNYIIYGKQLNNKVNRWKNLNIFIHMLEHTLLQYYGIRMSNALISLPPSSLYSQKLRNIRYFMIDSQFITNKLCSCNIGRNKFYKNKKGIKLTTIIDDNAIPISLLLDKGK